MKAAVARRRVYANRPNRRGLNRKIAEHHNWDPTTPRWLSPPAALAAVVQGHVDDDMTATPASRQACVNRSSQRALKYATPEHRRPGPPCHSDTTAAVARRRVYANCFNRRGLNRDPAEHHN